MKKIVALLLVVLLALSLCACTAATTQDTTDAYAGLAGDESVKQLVVVIGTDRTDAGAATTAP